MIGLIVGEKLENQRVDVAVAEKIAQLSRASARKLSDDGLVYVNGRPAKASSKLKVGDKLEIDYRAGHQVIPKIDLPVLYEDEDCLVINKPLGVLTHSKGAFNPEATVATFIASRVAGLSGDRAGIVHRLDRATSGVIICAKNPEALKWLQKQFSTRKVKKTYTAIVSGRLKETHAIIDMPIERNPKKPQIFRVGLNGKSAITEYQVTKITPKMSLLELKPTTGRTHQLRVHLSRIGHPILGDALYGGEPADRLYLHAHKLEVTLSSRERKVFVAKVPEEFGAEMKSDE